MSGYSAGRGHKVASRRLCLGVGELEAEDGGSLICEHRRFRCTANSWFCLHDPSAVRTQAVHSVYSALPLAGAWVPWPERTLSWSEGHTTSSLYFAGIPLQISSCQWVPFHRKIHEAVLIQFASPMCPGCVNPFPDGPKTLFATHWFSVRPEWVGIFLQIRRCVWSGW